MSFSALTLGAAYHPGARDHDQDAFSWSSRITDHGSYLITAVADGAGASDDSRAATALACGIATDLDYRTRPADLITVTAAALPALASVVEDPWPFDSFRHGVAPGEYPPDTTLVVAILGTDPAAPDAVDLHVAWIGDSRAYVLTADADADLHRVTDDHNVARYVEGGDRHSLTRSLGTALTSGPESAHWGAEDPRGRLRRVLLCSDGIHGVLTDPQIRSALLRTPTPQRAAERLVRCAVRLAGATADNATAVVIESPPATR